MSALTDTDREWLFECLTWIHRVCGERWSSVPCISIRKDHFPNSLATARPTPEHVCADLCMLLEIDHTRVKVSVIHDARDISGMPLLMEGLPTNSYVYFKELPNGEIQYEIELANAVLKHPRVFLKELVLRFSEIVAYESSASLEGPALQQLAELFSLYLGFAPVWCSSQGEVLYSSDGMWETKTRMTDPLPRALLIGAITLIHEMKSKSVDLDLLPKEVVSDVNRLRASLLEQAGKDFVRGWNAITHMGAGDSLQLGHRYVEAVDEYQKALFLADKDPDRAFLYNNIGYALTCIGEYQRSLSSFAQALKLDPEFAYAMDNMGYAHLMLGNLDTARAYLNKANNAPGNHSGYTLRNFALLHWLEGDMDAAGKEFSKALSEYGDVDLLEFHYARYLLEVGEPQAAIQFAEISAEKGEPAGLDLMKTLKA